MRIDKKGGANATVQISFVQIGFDDEGGSIVRDEELVREDLDLLPRDGTTT